MNAETSVPRKRSPFGSIVITSALLAVAGLVGWAILGRPTTVAKARQTLAEASNQAVGWPPLAANPSTPETPADPSPRVATGAKGRARPATPVIPSVADPMEPDSASAPADRQTLVASVVPWSSSLKFRLPDPPPDPTAYDSKDADIAPPVLLTSMSPMPKSPEMLLEATTSKLAIRVLVNEAGTVDLVNATLPPRTLAESILVTNGLAMAKTWQFRPAARSGRPVKYRLILPLSMF